MKKLLLLGFLSLYLLSCKEDKPDPVGSIRFSFDNRLREHPDFVINYFINNIKLKTADGSEHASVQSASVDAANKDSETIRLINVPFNTYTEVSFNVSIDVSNGDSFDYSADGLKYVFTTGDAPVNETTEPTIHLMLDIDKLEDDTANAFTFVRVSK